jgi:dipeptidase E
MKLYLSSYKLGNTPQDLASLVGENKRIAIISNSRDFSTDTARRQASIQKESDDLSALGLQPEELDLRDYYSQPEKLEARLSEVGGVWVLGGNTFVLRKAYEKSGMDEWVLRHRDDEFVYAGYSAGICVLAPSFKGLELVDDPEVAKNLFNEDVVWEGLGLLDYLPVPHYKSDHPESAMIDNVVTYLQKESLPYRTLRDGDVIVVDGTQDESNKEIRGSYGMEIN